MLKRGSDFAFGNAPSSANGTDNGSEGPGRRKRKSRWATDEEEKSFIPGMPTVIPPNLDKAQEEQYLLQLQIEEISRNLRTGDLGIPHNPEDRSPSPEPIYNNEGKRLNTREYRTRKKLEEQRHALILKQVELNEDYKPPADYKPPMIKVTDKVMIPQDDHPDINFVGLLIGPRGNTLKNLEKDTGAKIIIRGKGSVKEGKIGRKDGQPLPGEDEPLHAYITATNPENVAKASFKIKDIIQQGIEVPEQQNDLRRQQLRELALLNGTLRENDGLAKLKQLQEAQTIITNNIFCSRCGGTGHISQDCKMPRPSETLRTTNIPHNHANKAKMDSEYTALMAELGEGPPSAPRGYGHSKFSGPPPSHSHGGGFNHQSHHTGGRPTLQLPPPTFTQPQSRPPPNVSQSMGPPGISHPPPLMGGQQSQTPPWQHQNTSSSGQHFHQNPSVQSHMAMPQPAAAMAPPPPPPSSQHMPWQQPHQGYGMQQPQQQQHHPAPWQQTHHMTPPTGMPPPWQQHQMMPPPPPPGQNVEMGGLGIPLGVPPPPPPN